MFWECSGSTELWHAAQPLSFALSPPVPLIEMPSLSRNPKKAAPPRWKAVSSDRTPKEATAFDF